MIKLSVLICSVNSRLEKREALLQSLIASLGESYVEATQDKEYSLEKYIGKNAEVIVCTDNKQMKVGEKRNLLLKSASGKYISFVDDDDVVAYNYIEELIYATESNPDVIVFDVARYQNGKPDRMANYGIKNKHDFNTPGKYYRLPNHLMCVLRDIALQVKFKALNFGEDSDYAYRLLKHLKTEHRINKTLYAYYYDDKLTETRK